MLLASAGDVVVAGDLLNWYKTKIGEIGGLVTPTLLVVAGFFAVLMWVMYRSWKKAVVTLIGGAIVIAIVNQISNVADKVTTEFGSAPEPSRIVQLHHDEHGGGLLI